MESTSGLCFCFDLRLLGTQRAWFAAVVSYVAHRFVFAKETDSTNIIESCRWLNSAVFDSNSDRAFETSRLLGVAFVRDSKTRERNAMFETDDLLVQLCC